MSETQVSNRYCCFFPAEAQHVFVAISDTPVKVLVIYAPPYGESPDKVIKARQA